MRFTDKDLLKAMGLEVGGTIKIGNNNNFYKIIKNNNKIQIVNKITDEGLDYLIGKEFEKVKQKIWTVDTYELGEDKAYFINCDEALNWYRIHDKENLYLLDRNIYFTKPQYAEEYLKELKKFNNKYKESVSYE